MIDIKSLKSEDVGRWVIYKDFDGREEVGRIKSWNDSYIFVVYKRPGRDLNQFQAYTAVATSPEDLYFPEV